MMQNCSTERGGKIGPCQKYVQASDDRWGRASNARLFSENVRDQLEAIFLNGAIAENHCFAAQGDIECCAGAVSLCQIKSLGDMKIN